MLLKAMQVRRDRSDRQALTIQATLELASYEEVGGQETSKGDDAAQGQVHDDGAEGIGL